MIWKVNCVVKNTVEHIPGCFSGSTEVCCPGVDYPLTEFLKVDHGVCSSVGVVKFFWGQR